MFIQKFLLCRKAYCAFRIANIHQYQYSVHFAHLPCHPTQHPTQHVNATVHVQVQVQSYRHSKPEFLIPKLHQVQSYRPQVQSYRLPSSTKFRVTGNHVQSYRIPCSELQDNIFRVSDPQVHIYRWPLLPVKSPVPLNLCFTLDCGSVGP